MILREEVEQTMKKLKDRKSLGRDGMPASRANQSRRTSTDQRDTQLMSCDMARGRMAGTATKSVLVAIPKKGDLTDCVHYRTDYPS